METTVGAILVVVVDVRSKQPLQMRFIDSNHMIQQFAAAAADPLAHPGDQSPIQLKASPMLAHHGVGRDYNQKRFPRTPETMKNQPEQPVGAGKPGTASLSLEHCQLLTKGEIFNQQALTRAKQPKEAPIQSRKMLNVPRVLSRIRV